MAAQYVRRWKVEPVRSCAQPKATLPDWKQIFVMQNADDVFRTGFKYRHPSVLVFDQGSEHIVQRGFHQTETMLFRGTITSARKFAEFECPLDNAIFECRHTAGRAHGACNQLEFFQRMAAAALLLAQAEQPRNGCRAALENIDKRPRHAVNISSSGATITA